jgi:pimeloyl-ACP methyl ester carboxylesterase
MTYTSGLAEVNNTKIFYEMKGTGDPLILIHSGGFDCRIWDYQFEFFSEYNVIRYDVRGYGKSQAPTRPYSEQEDLYQLLKFFKIRKANVLGLSLGGRIAIDFAIIHPEMVKTLIAVSPGLSGYPYSMQDMMETMKIVYSIEKDDGAPAGEMWLRCPYNAPAMDDPNVGEKLRPIAIENSKSWLINPLFALPIFPPAFQRISEIQAPTLLILGDRDVPTTTKVVDTLNEGIANCKKVLITGAGHIVNMERPDVFNNVVQDFLNKY